MYGCLCTRLRLPFGRNQQQRFWHTSHARDICSVRPPTVCKLTKQLFHYTVCTIGGLVFYNGICYAICTELNVLRQSRYNWTGALWGGFRGRRGNGNKTQRVRVIDINPQKWVGLSGQEASTSGHLCVWCGDVFRNSIRKISSVGPAQGGQFNNGCKCSEHYKQHKASLI